MAVADDFAPLAIVVLLPIAAGIIGALFGARLGIVAHRALGLGTSGLAALGLLLSAGEGLGVRFAGPSWLELPHPNEASALSGGMVPTRAAFESGLRLDLLGLSVVSVLLLAVNLERLAGRRACGRRAHRTLVVLSVLEGALGAAALADGAWLMATGLAVAAVSLDCARSSGRSDGLLLGAPVGVRSVLAFGVPLVALPLMGTADFAAMSDNANGLFSFVWLWQPPLGDAVPWLQHSGRVLGATVVGVIAGGAALAWGPVALLRGGASSEVLRSGDVVSVLGCAIVALRLAPFWVLSPAAVAVIQVGSLGALPYCAGLLGRVQGASDHRRRLAVLTLVALLGASAGAFGPALVTFALAALLALAFDAVRGPGARLGAPARGVFWLVGAAVPPFPVFWALVAVVVTASAYELRMPFDGWLGTTPLLGAPAGFGRIAVAVGALALIWMNVNLARQARRAWLDEGSRMRAASSLMLVGAGLCILLFQPLVALVVLGEDVTMTFDRATFAFAPVEARPLPLVVGVGLGALGLLAFVHGLRTPTAVTPPEADAPSSSRPDGPWTASFDGAAVMMGLRRAIAFAGRPTSAAVTLAVLMLWLGVDRAIVPRAVISVERVDSGAVVFLADSGGGYRYRWQRISTDGHVVELGGERRLELRGPRDARERVRLVVTGRLGLRATADRAASGQSAGPTERIDLDRDSEGRLRRVGGAAP